MIHCFDGVKKDLRQKSSFVGEMGDLTFADSAQVPPLQAADLIAYLSHRFTKSTPPKESPLTTEFVRALYKMKSREDFWLFDKVRLDRLETVFAEVDKDAKKGNEHEK